MKQFYTNLFATTFAACSVAGAVSAATFYTDVVTWEAAMSSTSPITLPTTSSTSSFVAGDLTFSISGSATNLIVGGSVDWSTKIAGDDLAISSPEDVQIDFGTAVTGFSFLVHEPTTNGGYVSDSCNTVCVETTFNFKLFDGASEIGSFNFDPLNDVANFVGFSSLLAFNRIVIDDVTNTSDNEFFGEFRTGSIAAVPLPAGLPLLLVGLGALAAIRRRRRS